MRLIDADAMNKRRIDYIVNGYAESVNDMTEWGMALIEAPTIDAVEVGEWIPVSERLPKEKARVLTYDTMGDIVFGQYDKGRWYWEAEACADYWEKNDGVIAWMPLPKPYEERREP